MNNFTFGYIKQIIFQAFVILATAITLSSCGKTENTDTTISYLRVINASPSLATYNVYLNGNAINSTALPFLGSIAYTSRAAGNYGLKFTSGSSVESLYSKDITLGAGSSYSYYLVNKPGQLDGLIISEDISAGSTDKAYIRFINLSPDAPALDLVKTGTTTSYGENKAFKTANGFVEIAAGTYSIDAKETASGIIRATKTDAAFAAGYHYDVICGGLITPEDDTERSASLQVMVIK
ncbi:DUF4397 domain-containing protein [Pedobacter sp. Leaf176]|uniref:DUF4397 domain-containing protein n=1 Tax=Pedobacter sp. Leaf176 TaxID=1736286 RepID=UPI000701F4E6|nr:DUF4397 domain-containing protein [Pedobacter sp. Leaf176]KQR69745.1 hypothetical protein ASF92_13620 [Pedobacter sp. Leaf176]